MERIGDEVGRELGRGGGRQVLAVAEITAVWPEVVGDAVSRQSWPLRLGRDGTLHVATSSSTWAFELDRLGPEILERLSSALAGEPPSRLRFAPGPLPEPGAEAASEPPPTVLEAPAEVLREAAAAAAAIEDPELRELVARAARASLARARSGRRI